MAYSEIRIVIGGLAHEEPVKIIEVKDTVFKEGNAEAIKELSNKLNNIEQKADEVYEKVKKKKGQEEKKE